MRIIFLLVIALDQITKFLAIDKLKGRASISLIGEFFGLTYVENLGAAFGILQEQRWFFIVTTSIVVVAIILYMYKYRDTSSLAMKLSLQLILGGAIGNLIDRIAYGYVIDFFDIRFGEFYDFPVFNIADISVVVGTILITTVIIMGKEEIE